MRVRPFMRVPVCVWMRAPSIAPSLRYHIVVSVIMVNGQLIIAVVDLAGVRCLNKWLYIGNAISTFPFHLTIAKSKNAEKKTTNDFKSFLI